MFKICFINTIFRTANYPSNLTELIRITSDEVRLSFARELENGNHSSTQQRDVEKTPLVLHFPANQPLNNGQWNNLILSWNAILGHYSLVWNSVRIYSDKNYAVDYLMDIKLV